MGWEDGDGEHKSSSLQLRGTEWGQQSRCALLSRLSACGIQRQVSLRVEAMLLQLIIT
jgi:hypothetical protein